MKWYRFNQNNPGGEFKGKYKYVDVQAENIASANTFFNNHPEIFTDSWDYCECCGPCRWEEVRDWDETDDKPEIPVRHYLWGLNWLTVYADGTQVDVAANDIPNRF